MCSHPPPTGYFKAGAGQEQGRVEHPGGMQCFEPTLHHEGFFPWDKLKQTCARMAELDREGEDGKALREVGERGGEEVLRGGKPRVGLGGHIRIKCWVEYDEEPDDKRDNERGSRKKRQWPDDNINKHPKLIT